MISIPEVHMAFAFQLKQIWTIIKMREVLYNNLMDYRYYHDRTHLNNWFTNTLQLPWNTKGEFSCTPLAH